MPGSFPADPIQKGKALGTRLRHVTSSPHDEDFKEDIFKHAIYPSSFIFIYYIFSELRRGPPARRKPKKPGLNRVNMEFLNQYDNLTRTVWPWEWWVCLIILLLSQRYYISLFLSKKVTNPDLRSRIIASTVDPKPSGILDENVTVSFSCDRVC